MIYTTPDGYTLRVFSSMYSDWGLSINGPNGEELFYSPHALSTEAYGLKPAARFDSWEDAEAAFNNGDETALVDWTHEEWAECLESEAWELIEAFVPEED